MLELSRRPSVAITLLVALTTVCALALPEGIGGRDSVVRLTRGGPQRLGCADAVCHDHDAPEAVVVFHDGDLVTVLPPLSAPPTAPGAARAPLENTTP